MVNTMEKDRYTKDFFDRREDSLHSAKIIVPILSEYITPKSVLDVGCGTGAFLSVFEEQNGSAVFGVDGPWVAKEQLLIPANNFLRTDLEQPLDLKKKFDLVISLEVAEHISASSAKTFVGNLVRHGDVVLFSAAIPHQGGTHHINEQWPEYWAALFFEYDYVPIDCMRGKLWQSPEVSFWYAQNTFFFVKKEALSGLEPLKKEYEKTGGFVSSLVHPILFEAKAKKADRFDKLTRFIPYSLKSALLKLFR